MNSQFQRSPKAHSPLSVSFRLCLFVLLLVAAGCGGLAGEPEIIATFPVPTAVREAGFPQQPPNLTVGAQLYAENCTRCHGFGGFGDGEFVLSGQIARPRDFTDVLTASGQTPLEWYTIITQGRLDQGMPPWSRALNESQRWAVAMYTYTMTYSPDLITQGAEVWQANCADCHGASGRGDGPRAAEIGVVGDLTSQSRMVTLSDTAIAQLITQGRNNMPAFAELDEQERRAVVAYTRTLALTGSDAIGQPIEPVATPEADEQAAVEPAATAEVSEPLLTGQIVGRVINGTAGAVLPPDLKVTLVIHDAGNIERLEANVSADGGYVFDAVALKPTNTYFVTTNYSNHVFLSAVAQGTDIAASPFDLPVTVYETTDDPTVIKIVHLLIRVRPTQQDSLNGLEVTQLFVFNNTSDRLYITNNEISTGIYESLTLPLPANTEVIGVDNPQRYIRASDQPGVIDTEPVQPGEHIAQITYFLPYADSATVNQPLPYELSGNVSYMVAPTSLSLSGDNVVSGGQEVLENENYQFYDADLSLAAGGTLTFQLSGSVTGVRATSATADNPLPTVLIIAGVGLLGAGAAVYLWDRRKQKVNKQRQAAALITQIAELDEAYEAGQIHDKVYQRQRSQLKARLAELMGEQSEQP